MYNIYYCTLQCDIICFNYAQQQLVHDEYMECDSSSYVLLLYYVL